MDAAGQRALDILGLMRLEDGSAWADTAVAYQREHAQQVVERAGPSQTWIELPRGGRKTTDIAALSLALLLTQAPRSARAYVGASDEDQAAELVDAARGLIDRTPELEGEFQVNELTITCTRNSASLTALPADASAYGKRAWLVILDEVSNWPDTRKGRRFWSVLMSGNRKLAECRTVVISNSGDPSHWPWKRRETARVSRYWAFFSVPGPLPWLTEDDLATLRENAITESEFEQLHLNRWVASEDRLATRADLAACTVLPGVMPPRPGCEYVITLDLGHTFDRSVCAVQHAAGGKVTLDRIQRWQGTRAAPVSLGEVRDTVHALWAEFRPARVVMDPAEGRLLAQELRELGVDVTEFNFNASSVGRLAVSLHQAIRQHRLELPDDEDLLDELATVRLRKNGVGIYRMDTDSGGHDDQAVTLALGVVHLLDADPPQQFVVFGDDAAAAGTLNRFGAEVMHEHGSFARRDDRWDAWAAASRDDDEPPVVRTVQLAPWASN